MKLIIVFGLMTLSLFASIKEVTVSILPQKYFVEKIAQDKIKVNVMVQPGFSPATYEPKTSQMKRLNDSLIYFSIGVPFEHVWLKRFASANSTMRIVDTSKGIEKLAMAAHTHHDEEHDNHEKEKEEHGHHDKDEHEDKHEHEGGLDPHIWLDPILVKQQAKTILDALIGIDSINKTFYEENYEQFIKELDVLHKEIETILHDMHDKAFMVFHPSWGYFAKRYDLEQIAVEKEGKEPKPKELAVLIEEAKKYTIKVVFVAPQFSQKAAKTIAQSINAKVVKLDHLSYDYMNNLKDVALIIQTSYK